MSWQGWGGEGGQRGSRCNSEPDSDEGCDKLVRNRTGVAESPATPGVDLEDGGSKVSAVWGAVEKLTTLRRLLSQQTRDHAFALVPSPYYIMGLYNVPPQRYRASNTFRSRRNNFCANIDTF
eukprot:365538-Chlamydomonas_euryale.AAC.5